MGPEGRSLVLGEETDAGSYELRMYLYDGNVVEEYSVAGAAYTPTRAQVLFKSSTFEFELDGKLLTIITDQGKTEVALRSWQGVAR